MLRVATLCAAIALMGCNQQQEPVQTQDPAPAPKPVKVEAEPLKEQESVMKQLDPEVRMIQPSLSLALPDSQWSRQSSLDVAARVENTTAHAMELTLLSGMTADLILSQGKQPVWQFSHERMFTQALRPWTLEAGEHKALTFTISSDVLSALEPGEYNLQVELNTLDKPRSARVEITLE
ncbi:BsuPI-related putative proteinase inhibitor [Ferrimonas futtsuensis]|uniref:BsuPI-related putative proteinase inhibitor n=1 Tax=Ferrimonas futtsuensis TaxID=364764 RepID=UPI000409F9EB|nr:BsuPI-related putative proteinase inhibitor [Ferrimonas futtsuensis]